MFWIALKLSIPKIGLNMISLTVKKLDAFKIDGVAEYDNTESCVFYRDPVLKENVKKTG